MSIIATLAGSAVAAVLATGGVEVDSIPAPQTPASSFKAYTAKHGTAAERDAVEHVDQVRGLRDRMNNILDTADVFTDFTDGFGSANAGEAKLIASAFADWKHSKNGLVTIYGSDGKMITNGTF